MSVSCAGANAHSLKTTLKLVERHFQALLTWRFFFSPLLLLLAIYNGIRKKRKSKENDFKKYNFDMLYCINCNEMLIFYALLCSSNRSSSNNNIVLPFISLSLSQILFMFFSTSFICFVLFFLS